MFSYLGVGTASSFFCTISSKLNYGLKVANLAGQSS